MISPADEQARRRERRAAIRAHHPDAGGDPARLQAELRAVDERYHLGTPPVNRNVGAPQSTEPRDYPLSTVVWARIRVGVRAVRERIPPGWPGHRRMIDISGCESRGTH